MFDAFLRRIYSLGKRSVQLLLLGAVLIGHPAWAQSNCGRQAPSGNVTHDFNPDGARPKPPQGKIYHMPDVLRDEFLAASWLQGFYNGAPGYGRGLNWHGGDAGEFLHGMDMTGVSRQLSSAAKLLDLTAPQESDSLILSRYFVNAIRKQAQVEAVVDKAKGEVRNNAREMLKKLDCGQSGMYSSRDPKGPEIVQGDDYSFSVHLAIGSFSVYWEATCSIGPKRCCVKDIGSGSGYREMAEYSCRINFTIYDNYNFSWRSGTGGTGLLKRINPLGWFGTSFHQYGRWNETATGTVERDMSAAEVAAKCCSETPRTVVEPPPPPPPPPPKAEPLPPPPPPEPQWSDANPCPECQPFLDLAEKHRQAAEDLDAQAQETQERLQANRQRQRATQQRIDQINREIGGKAGEGGSATDPDSGLTTESWTQADGSVKVTVKDARGNVLSEHTRQRRDVARLREQLAREEAELARLKAEESKLDADLERAVKGRQTQRKLEADARAELHRCVEERCNRRTATALPQAACAFPAAQPVAIGPREKFGYGDEQKAGEVGKAAIGILGGFLGGRGGGSGGRGGGGGPFQGGPSGGDRPRLADDPIRDKQTFTDPQTGTAIKVGGQYRPDGKLLVSVDVDKAEDKGVVHQATMERLAPQPDGSCRTQVAEPVEWQHYEIWEDWWAKIRIQRYESVDGGPWRKTHDTGWRDWDSGSRLLAGGMLPADQISRTAWGSMGADRAFGGPRSAGAVFDPGQPLVTGRPAAGERLVVHVTRPGQDPVTTVPFTLYPTYGADGKVSYGNTAPSAR